MTSTTKLSILSVVLAAMLAVSCALPWKRKSDDNEKSINLCLMACAMCFDSENTLDLLMGCANGLCLEEMKDGKPLGPMWAKHCPGLGKIWRKQAY